MIVTTFRSSSFNQFDMCQFSYTLSYLLGIKDKTGAAATRGNISHKALECLARKKLALQRDEEIFWDDELKRQFTLDEAEPHFLIDIAYDHYTTSTPHLSWAPKDRRECHKLMDQALELDGGIWNPLHRNVVAPELYFDFEIEAPWAAYSFPLPDGTELTGQLGLKGTVDLVTRLDDGVLEYVDWKTGARKDWSVDDPKKSVKTYQKLRNDPQLRIYHYALSRLFPDAKEIIMSIVYIKDGGGFSLAFGKEDIAITEEMLRKRFDIIKNTVKPKARVSYRCKTFCTFGKNNQLDKDGNDTGVTICDHFRREVDKKGLDRVVAETVDITTIGQYGQGGGQSNRGTLQTHN